eukprot:jgi/Chrpa1/11066/Chrysochromulina_OHIO_Genome00011922-RA
MADIRRERSVREPQETQFVGLTGAILRAVEICGAVLVRAWDAILRLGTKFPSAMWAGTDAILRFGFEFEVGFIALFALVIFIGSRYETVFLLFKSKPGEAIEWELVLCVTLLIVFIGLPLLPLETHIREQKLPAYLLYAMVLVLIFSFIIFDTSVGLVDLLDDGNFTKYDIEERKENLLVSVLNIVLIMSIAQIFYLRTRLQITPQMDLAIEQAFGLKRIEELHARWSGKSSSIEEKEVLIEREASSGRLGFGVDQTSSSLDRNPNMVVEVDPTGPAASELQAGDIIIAVDGELLNGRKFIEHSSIKPAISEPEGEAAMIAHAWENRQSHVWENWQSHVWENWHEPACGNMGAEPQRAANLLIRRSSLRAWCLHGAATSVLAKALSKPRPVIVHVYDARPSELLPYAIEDVSMACRESGATAVLVGPELVECFAKEQESARGNFPGPLPVIVDTALRDMGTSPEELCEGAKTLGASAIGLRYYTGDYPDATELEAALQRAVAAAEASSLTTILLGEFGADGDEGVAGASAMASSVGAAAALTKGNEQGGAPAFGCWRGSEDELQRLRACGVDGLIIKNACRGDVGRGAHLKLPSPAAVLVTKQVKAALSKGSKSVWAGAGGVGLASDGGDVTRRADDYFNKRGPK